MLKRSTSKKTPPKKSAAPQAATPSVRKSSVNFEVIQDYTDFMKANDLVEIDFKGKDYSVRLRRFEGSVPSSNVSYAAPVSAPVASPKPVATPRTDLHVVKSPFVGTFYRSAGPNQEPFVEEGKIVNDGDALCIIEAMKLMNEIESDIKGRIVRVLVKNGTPVEFGEGLFEIEPV
ncbi:MAG: acetyl-CoA carboxylase biotin carboxyl carrier protein [Bdellovibrionota bacterium]